MNLNKNRISKDIKFNTNLVLSDKFDTKNFLVSLSESLGLIGKKFDKYFNHLSCISANLILAILNGKTNFIYYSRDNNFYKNITRYNSLSITVRKTTKIMDLLFENGFVSTRPSRFISYAKEQSIRSGVKPTHKFLELVENYLIKREHIEYTDSDVIILKNSKKELTDYKDNDFTNKIRKDCINYNNILDKTKITLANNKVVNDFLRTNIVNYNNKNYYRVFNEDFNNGGRFYGPWWLHQIPSVLRKHILINGKKTIEHDYSSLIIHQIYSEVGLNYFEENTYSNDPYSLNGVSVSERKINKTTIQIALNCKNFNELNNALLYEFKKGNLKGRKPSKKEIEKRLNIFKEMNPKISDYIYSKCALRFQCKDSEIARYIIKKCNSLLIPVLSIHDSFIVEETNGNFIIDTMISAIKNARLTSIPLIK